MKNPDDKTRVSLLYYAETEAEFLFKDKLDTYGSQDERQSVFYSIKDGAGDISPFFSTEKILPRDHHASLKWSRVLQEL